MAPKPTRLTFEEAASLPFVALTSWRGLVDTAQLKPHALGHQRKKIFINGGSGGVGFFSVQLLKHWGHHVVATCSAHNFGKLQAAGADMVLDYKSQQFEDFVLSSKDCFDVVLDTVGGQHMETISFHMAKQDGHFLSLKGRSNITFSFFTLLIHSSNHLSLQGLLLG